MKIKRYWYYYLCGIVFFIELLCFAIFREESYIQIHDNLDLFIPHLRMIKLQNAFFTSIEYLPMLGGINRDLLGSEFQLHNFLYIIFPEFYAYIAGYFAKILIGFFGFIFMFKEYFPEKYLENKAIVSLCALAFGLIPVFPLYGIAFTSLPFLLIILRRIHKGDKNILFILVFLYPILSYFSYHGFFILAYMCLAVMILWIIERKFPFRLFISIPVLSLGYVLIEYRLFRAMLFDETVTIRQSMSHGDLSLMEALHRGFGEFLKASFHSQDAHHYIVLYVVLIGLALINGNYLLKKEVKKMEKEPLNMVFLLIVFNALIYGIYAYKPFREFIEMLVPKLKGFDFGRTAFFNPFLWYLALALVLCKLKELLLQDHLPKSLVELTKKATLAVSIVALLCVMLAPELYNDFYNTIYNQAYKIIKKKDTSTLNYREFYSTKLFDKIAKELPEIKEEYCAAFGLHPGVLIYNGIETVDGYLGMYSEEYKEKWIEIMQPAFMGSPSLKEYFTSWGARVYLFSASDENTYAPLRKMNIADKRLMINKEALYKLGCRYIISRIEISNINDIGLIQKGSFTDETSPYVLYVYALN